MSRTLRCVASRFSNGSDYSFELAAAAVSGDLAYAVGYERETASVDGSPAERNKLRVTHVYWRETARGRSSTGMAVPISRT